MTEDTNKDGPITTKECFGKCGNVRIRWSDHASMHYIATDEAKMSECDRCEVFAQCSWRVQIRIFKELIKWYDEDHRQLNVIL
jgi:hypothetical protein